MIERCLLTFKSVHYRLTAEQILQDCQILVEIVPVPQDIRTNCDKALEVDCEQQARVVEILNCQNIGIEKVIKINIQQRLLEKFRRNKDAVSQ